MKLNDYLGLLLSLMLAMYFIISVMRYFPSVKSWLDRVDKFTLVPTWTFFAPEPNSTDYYLFYRVFSDNVHSPWRLVEFGRKREWYGFLWNPNRRDRKAFFDLCQLVLTVPADSAEEIMYGAPYLLILNHVNYLCDVQLGELVQFTIARKVPFKKDDLSEVFMSNIHQLS